MYAWTYDADADQYEYYFEGYEAYVDMDGDHWGFVVYLAGEVVEAECGYGTVESTMVAASNAIWNDYQYSSRLLSLCGA